MKRILSFLVLGLLAMNMASAQNNSSVYLVGSGLGSDIYAITNWGAFSSDSARLVFSGTFPLADYDSVDIFVRGASVTGAAKWSAGLFGGFGNTASATLFDSLGSAGDTTAVKTEVLAYVGRLATNGTAVGAIRVSGRTQSIHNPADSKVFIYLVGYRRGWTGNR